MQTIQTLSISETVTNLPTVTPKPVAFIYTNNYAQLLLPGFEIRKPLALPEPRYRVDELDEDTQTKVLDSHRESMADENWWETIIDEFKTNIVKTHGFTVSKVWFSGFCSQGDGLAFEGRLTGNLNNNKIEELFIKTTFPEQTKNALKLLKAMKKAHYIQFIDNLSVSCKNGSRHSYRISVSTNFDSEIMEFLPSTEEEITNSIEEVLSDLAHNLYKQLEQEYDHITSDENIIEYLNDSDYWFDEDGEQITI